jgi:DNA-binding NtrC family response regulator
VRELENSIERALALGNHKMVDIPDLPPAIASTAPAGVGMVSAASVNTSNLEEMERETIRRVFEQCKGDKVMAGRTLGISRATLYRKLKRYNIEPGAPRMMGMGAS